MSGNGTHPESELSGAAEPLDGVDMAILDALREVQASMDPMPSGLVQRATFAVALAEVEAEIARLVVTDTSAGRLVGLRSGDPATARSITFATDDLTLTLMVGTAARGSRRLDGWLAGDGSAAMTTVGVRLVGRTLDTDISEEGRFGFDELPMGMAQVSIVDEDGVVAMVTPAFQL